MDHDLVIPNHANDERVWVVRASGGQYVRHFKSANVVAIGHLDAFNFAPDSGRNTERLTLSKPELSTLMLLRDNVPKATVTSHLSQVEKFCKAIRCGDLVVTVDSSEIAVGRVVGYPFFDKTPVDLSTADFKDDPMIFQLRRDVSWGPSYARRKLPLPLERVFNTHTTVFEISKHWDLIYHILYPIFSHEEDLHVSLNIRKEDAIRNSSLIRVLQIFHEFERLAAQYGDDPSFDTLTIQAGFYSPGDLWPKVSAKGKKKLIFTACLAILLGGGTVGELSIGNMKLSLIKLNGLGDVAKKVLEGAAEIIKSHDAHNVIEDLQMKVPNFNTAPIDNSDKKPKNQETILIA